MKDIFWAARYKERQMKRNLRKLEKYGKQAIDTQQRSMEDFFAAATSDAEIEEDKVSEDTPLDELTILSDEALSRMEEEIESDEQQSVPQLTDSELASIDKFFTEDDDSAIPDKIKIIVDSREAKSGIARELSQLDLEIVLQQITVGDFVLSSRVGVERKDVADFSQSIIDGRLFPQLIALKRSYPVPILIIEGETLYGHRAINPEAIRGAISTITLNFDIRIIWSRSTKDTARYLRNIANREQRKSDRTPSIRTEKAPIETSELLEFIIAGFPNINAVLAKRILDKFGTLENFFNASAEEIQEIKGIGKKIALEIKELLTATYKPEE